MENPWLQLPKEPPFILPCDADAIKYFNARQRDTRFKIMLNEIPSPYIGNPESPVVFLNLNPACSPEESNSPQIAQYRKVARMNLLHQFINYPFYVLDPSLEGTPSGYGWFKQKFDPLVHATNMSDRKVSGRIFLVEFFPYRSQKCNWKGGILPSQAYAVSLVEKAIAHHAVIVIMRSKRFWINAVPALNESLNRYILHSPQNVIISENNLGIEGFQTVTEKLCR